MIQLLKFIDGPWEKARKFLKNDLDTIQAAINQRWAATFGNNNLLPPVAGGTGIVSPPAHRLLVGEGASPVASLPVATNGQLPIGSTGADPVISALTPGTGITIVNGPGSITISSILPPGAPLPVSLPGEDEYLSEGWIPPSTPAIVVSAPPVIVPPFPGEDEYLVEGWAPTPTMFGGAPYSVITSAATGAQNNFNPGFMGNTLVTLTGAAPAITGLAGGFIGQIIIFKNTGTGVATFANNSGSSSAGNKLFNYATSGLTPIAPTGFIAYLYDGTQWQIVGHDQGQYITRTFAAGNYTTGSSMTWTVASASRDAYKLSGRQMNYSAQVTGTTAVAGGANLKILIPGGFTSIGGDYTGAVLDEAGAFEFGDCQTLAADTSIYFQRLGAVNHVLGSPTGVLQSVLFEVT